MKSEWLPRQRYEDIVDTSGSLKSLELSRHRSSQPFL